MIKTEAWDMGHKPGYEFKRLVEYCRANNLSRKEFRDLYNDPKHYRPEKPSTNRSHRLEGTTSLWGE